MPLKPIVLEVLLALADEPRHGWDLVADMQRRLHGESILPGNFYRTLRRMLVDGLIQETVAPRDADSSDERRRYFQLTEAGRHAAAAEGRRLQSLVNDRRLRRLLRAR
jgi:DNA-binding PadR family transcriptional regulator